MRRGWKVAMAGLAVAVITCILVVLMSGGDGPDRGASASRAQSGTGQVTAEEILALQSADTEELVGNLASPRPDLVRESLGVLRRGGDPAGQEKARNLLGSHDPYVWLNAALYLGALGDPVAVPSLIRGLGHPAYRTHEQIAQMLQSITGESLGSDQKAWIKWWQEQHPDSQFDFSQ
jgi:hypothetical protein